MLLVRQMRRIFLVAIGFGADVQLLAVIVDLTVVLEMVFAVEGAIADSTAERSAIGMDKRVPHQLELGRERFLAIVTLERLLL